MILRVKSIIIIIIINLDQTSSSKPKKIGVVKGCLTQVTWCVRDADQILLFLTTLLDP